MKTLTHEEITKLAQFESPVCLTLTMPCMISGDQQKQNPIRFKNLMQEAEKKLEKIGWDERKIREFLSPLQTIDEEQDFWKNQDRGLLVCLAEGFFDYYKGPFEMEVNAVVDTHFYLRPIIPNMQQDMSAVLLLLNPEAPALVFASGAGGDVETKHPQKPFSSFSEYMGHFDTEKSIQFRTQKSGSRDSAAPDYHGQGASGDDATKKTHLSEYLKQVENWIYENMAHSKTKELYLIADPQTEGLYKKTMRKGHIDVHTLAQKNPKSEPVEHWVSIARNKKGEAMQERSEQAIAEFQRRQKQDEKTVEDSIDNIVRAACNKRIDTLILPEGSQDYYWGRFDPATQDVSKQTKDESVTGSGDELVNLAVIKTFLNGGTVFSARGNNAPGYAAICNW